MLFLRDIFMFTKLNKYVIINVFGRMTMLKKILLLMVLFLGACTAEPEGEVGTPLEPSIPVLLEGKVNIGLI